MEVDINKIRIPNNLVAVKLDIDHQTYHSVESGEDTGLYVAPWGVNQASHLALTGTVIRMPEKLAYNGYKLAELKKDRLRTTQDQEYIADLRNKSVSYDVPMEIQVGHRVYFEYRTRLDAYKEGRYIDNEQGNFILIPYDSLILVFNPTTDFADVKVTDVYPLNGFLLIKPLEYATEKGSDGIVGVKTELDMFMPVTGKEKFVKRGNCWFGNILAAGCGVKHYADFPDRGGEVSIKEMGRPGQKVAYDGRQQKRLEVEHHRVIFKKHILYRIHRKDIISWFPDGKIN